VKKQVYKPIPLAIALAAQQAYAEAAKKEVQTQGAKPANLSLNPGWGGQGK